MKPLDPTSAPTDADWVVEALGLALTAPTRQPLVQQLTAPLRQWIREGRLTTGQRLPSTRRLARELKIGRNSVLAAIDQLVAEGFVEPRQGAGSFVCDLPFASFTQDMTRGTAPRSQPPVSFSLSRRGEALLPYCATLGAQDGAFTPGLPALDQFPRETWQRLLRKHQRMAPDDWLGYRTLGGVPALREALADYLSLSRSVRCHAEQIIIVQGAQQGFELIARLLADPGDRAWIEEPGYGGAQACFQMAGLDLVPLPVSDEGLDVDSPAALGAPPRLIYVTPSHQYPSGVTMSLSRRLALLEAADHHGAWIVEDDYDSEFRYGQRPIPALQGLTANARVIYVGTFSKVLYPGLRLGYLVVPEALVAAMRRANARLHREGQYATQSALAEFITGGHFSRHIKRMRGCYRKRQALLRHTLAPAVAKGLRLSEGQAGMHLVAQLESHSLEDALVDKARGENIALSPLSHYYLLPPGQPGLVLGYAGASDAQIERAGRWLAGAWLALSAQKAMSSV